MSSSSTTGRWVSALLFVFTAGAPLLAGGRAAGQAAAPLPPPAAVPLPVPAGGLLPTPFKVAAPTGTYTLSQALDLAFRAPLTALRWQVSQDRANQGVALARANLQPVFSTSTTARLLNSRDLLTYSADQAAFAGERFRVGLNASYPLYDAGRRIDELHIAQAGQVETEATLRGEKLSLLDDVIQTFYSVLQEQRLIDTVQLVIAEHQQNLSAATTRYGLGTVTKGDVLNAQSALASSIVEADQRSLALTQGRAHLALLMGFDPTKSIPEVAVPQTAPDLQLSLDQLLVRILQNDPTRARLLAQKTAARAQLSVIRAEKTPTVDMRASTGYVVQDHNVDGSGGDRPYSYLLVNLNVPLLSRERDRARERSQLDDVELLDLSIQQNEYDIRERVLAAYNSYQESLARVEAAQAALTAAAEAQRLAQEQYAVGTATQAEVQSAIIRLTEERDRLSEALNTRDTAGQRLRWMASLDPSYPPSPTPAAP